MKRILPYKGWVLAPVLMCLHIFASAQNITKFQYWFDGNIASATTISTAATVDVNLSSALAASSLSIGYHKVTARFQDSNGSYSVPITYTFVKADYVLSGYRYWYDGNIASATTVSISPSMAVNLTAALSTSSLSNGYHTITIQFKDVNGVYSSPQRKTFVKSGFNISAYDYWWDNNYSNHTMVNVNAAQTIDLSASITPVNIDTGQHIFAIRFKDLQGNWSVPIYDTVNTTVFFTGVRELASIHNVSLFPNPTHANTTLSFNGGGNEILDMTLTDAFGKTVQQQQLQNGNALQNFELKTDGLASGIYFVKLASAKGATTRQLVVQ